MSGGLCPCSQGLEIINECGVSSVLACEADALAGPVAFWSDTHVRTYICVYILALLSL